MVKVYTTSIDITPEYPIHILGHSMRSEKSKGVHDSIEFVLLWLEVDNKRFLFVTADLLGVDFAFTKHVREQISEVVSVDKNCIHICATHTHSAPLMNDRDSRKTYDPRYRKHIIDKLVQVAIDSYHKVQPIQYIKYKTGVSNGFYGNRDSKSSFGDQSITYLQFLDKDYEEVAGIVTMACHATVLSPVEYQLSADLLGAIRRELSWNMANQPLVINGAAGDMSTRLYRQGNDFEELKRVSIGIAQQIKDFSQADDISLTKGTNVTFTFTSETEIDVEEMNTRVECLKRQLEETKDFDDRKWFYSELQDAQEQLKQRKYQFDFETTILSFKELEIIILPCEISAILGSEIKRHSKAKLCMIFGYANGQTTYVVERAAFKKGHGGIVTKLKMGEAEKYIEEIKKQMEQLNRGSI